MSNKNKCMLPTVAKGVPRLLNVNREPSRPKKRRKITVTFDETKRKEFLTGFHKRNVEKRQKAKERFIEKFKEEKKRITEQAKAKFNTYLSQRDIPELEELLAKHEYESDGKTVSILELDVNGLTQSANWIGDNKPCYEKDETESEEEDETTEDDTVPGMELKEKKQKSSDAGKMEQLQISKKAIAKEIMRKTHKSRLFKLKQQHECSKNKKKAEREKKQQERALKKARGKTKIKLERQLMKRNKNNNNNKKSKK